MHEIEKLIDLHAVQISWKDHPGDLGGILSGSNILIYWTLK